ncbi:MAG: FG-GAP and VCBS repeat-containing protein, partial [Bacteroidota bacterium]|nr:FG-GAP and VCBS repeat-containing protein [Bacteroidota bacterium]
MRYHHQSNAPPGCVPQAHSPDVLQCGICAAIVLLFIPSMLHAQSIIPPDELARPDYVLEILTKIQPRNHPGFGRWTAPLGDLDGDGYDDFAVSTLADTTFIFLGGDPLDHEPAFFVLGGAMGLTAGDFNGDGLVDIVTARSNLSLPDPELKGTIRIYLNTGGLPPYPDEPDRVMVGDIRGAQVGYSRSPWHSGVISADLNGDGIADLLYTTTIRFDPAAEGRLNLILGGQDFIERMPYQFQPHPRGRNASFARTYMTGDLNGDGCDDLMIFGDDVDTLRNQRIQQMSLYLGNREGLFDGPDIVNRDDSAWVVARQVSNVCDVNGDGCDDILNGYPLTLFGSAHLFRSSPALTLHRSIWLNDSIPNQFPDFYIGPHIISPVGDMNGDGYDDFIVGVSTLGEPNGTVYLLHPAGPLGDWKTATGRVGIIPERDHLNEGAFPAGDVNGDGFEDIILVGRPSKLDADSPSQRVWLFRGSPRLRTGVESPPSPDVGALEVWPRPLPAGESLSVRLPGTGRGILSVYDLLGRTHLE